VKIEQVAELPKFDTGQYEGCEFSIRRRRKIGDTLRRVASIRDQFLSRALGISSRLCRTVTRS
jgi:hypothetical protein